MSNEDLDSVRRRPGAYIGSVDETGLHALAGEVINNAMDEAIGGHCTAIEITLNKDSSLTVADNGRGIPVDIMPKFGKSALEVIFTHLHSAGRLQSASQAANDRPSGIGVSVVNALSDWLWVEVARDKELFRISFAHGKPTTKVKKLGRANERRGTSVCFHPDPEIFGDAIFKPAALYTMAQTRARFFGGVEIRWKCDPGVSDGETPTNSKFHFPKKF